MSAKAGAFVVVEGIDGAGTTTLSTALVQHYKAKSVLADVTREPSGGPIGALIRQILSHRVVVPDETRGARAPGWATMGLLFAADRVDHLEAEILPRLAQGVMVICDRYDLSSLIYQSITAPGATGAPDEATVAWIRALNEKARRPDLTIVVDTPAAVAEARRGARGGPRELFEKDELQRRLAAAYAAAESFVPGDRLVHLDGSRAVNALLSDAVRAVDEVRGTEA